MDDNRDGADSLAEMSNLLGNEIRSAYDGEEAVTSSTSFRPDVTLLDIGLPKLNGSEAACRRIREHPWGKWIVVIAQTGWGQEGDRQRAHKAGFDHHLAKPVDPPALVKRRADFQAARA